MVVSRKLTLLVECDISNWMVGWNELRCLVKVRNDSSPCTHTRKISSMNLFHSRGVRLFGADDNIDFSSEPMKILAYEGAIFVPIAVPCV